MTLSCFSSQAIHVRSFPCLDHIQYPNEENHSMARYISHTPHRSFLTVPPSNSAIGPGNSVILCPSGNSVTLYASGNSLYLYGAELGNSPILPPCNSLTPCAAPFPSYPSSAASSADPFSVCASSAVFLRRTHL
jgi:hypothetical protein